ncbi:hypothetical protein EBME_2262 [bacterium endosymbiont of Mortierella elongata FMR23-6]|nr:hypothetical protein EBME_2262 [bacterium endosymbiont of Mortierella elongata FMR23-6]
MFGASVANNLFAPMMKMMQVRRQTKIFNRRQLIADSIIVHSTSLKPEVIG